MESAYLVAYSLVYLLQKLCSQADTPSIMRCDFQKWLNYPLENRTQVLGVCAFIMYFVTL